MITVGLYGIPDRTQGERPFHVHDHGVALMRDGQVLTVVQLERWTGVKHDHRLPRYLSAILARLLPPGEPVRFVSVNSFEGDTFQTLDGSLRIEPTRDVPISAEPVPATVTWRPDRVHQEPAEGWVLSHEAAHLGSILPFVGRFQDNALAAHIDGGASRSACSFWRIQDGKPVLLEASWDLLKDVVNNFNVNPAVRAILGFKPEEHLAIPGRLMGYAAFGTPDPELMAWLKKRRWLLDTDDHHQVCALLLDRLGTLDPHATPCMDFCATLQQAFEDAVVTALRQRAPERGTLYYTGGAALNIPTNTLLHQYFDTVWIPPGTNDSGLALGAAAWIEYLDHGHLHVHDPFLNRFDVPQGEPPPDAVPEVARRLLQGQVIGVCNGPAEFGPRALGHRSLLARADRVETRQRVSEQIKRREWYRPVAPILCEEAAAEVLEPQAVTSPLSRWMLGAWRVREPWHDHLRGVLHADGTVRAQVVHRTDGNTWIHSLLETLWHDHGVPALINTSFNGPGQAIVQRMDEARATARRLGLDGVVLHGSLH